MTATHRAAVTARRHTGITATPLLAQQLLETLVSPTVAGDRLNALLGPLTPEQRRTLILVYFGGYQADEIAVMDAVSTRTVLQRLTAAITRLRQTTSSAIREATRIWPR